MPMPRSEQVELLDAPAGISTAAVLRDNLRDIRRVNRFFGGSRATLGALLPFLHESGASETIDILDVATGSADIPLAIARRARSAGRSVRIVATDFHPEVLAVAREQTRGTDIVVERADALSLPYGDREFDIAVCSLALHHFSPADALRLLAEMRRVSRRAMVVNDLERSRLGLAGAWLVSRVLTGNPVTRHDAPLSVQRAYTPSEALDLGRRAGWRQPAVRRAVPFRFVLTGRP